MEASSRLELEQAHAELWNLTFSYLKSMALECAVQLNIPNVIHNFGGKASLPNILSAIPVPEHRRPYLPRLMRFLVVSGILSFDSPTLGEGRDPQFNKVFNAGLGSNSRLVLDFVVAQYGDVFDGISSLLDVGGGDGSTARTIAKAFSHVKCSVLDLPIVIADIQPGDGLVDYIAGDMFSSIPPTDAIVLKYVLHDWNDDDCVKILDQCKKAIRSCKPAGGKVIIIDTVVGSPLKEMFEAQVTSDLLMMVIAGGKERDKQEWHKIFMESGFKDYKIRPVLGYLSIIELYL
ncbi:unnamed protein product [Miscanthus lutarioriparius]|uniref:Uncharacterized protein n=1 Tax=Miscanthus lutarioriparius TaxID=422564 RepID=A0A811SMN8_9POAL|nr:unnamed protein product [Miscanthus lutarioriparius]